MKNFFAESINKLSNAKKKHLRNIVSNLYLIFHSKLAFLVVSKIPNRFTDKWKIIYYQIAGRVRSLMGNRHRILTVKQVSFTNNQIIWQIKCTDGIVFIPDLSRISRFIWGINHALSRLSHQYHVKNRDIADIDFVVDGGANIGEFAWWAIENGASAAIIVEPDPKNIECAKLNLQRFTNSKIYFTKALSSTMGKNSFYLSPDSANSSLQKNMNLIGSSREAIVETITLDHIFDKYLQEKSFFLKLDAEGHEPEIVSGGMRFFEHCEGFAIDVSAERNQKSTQNEVGDFFTTMKIDYDIIETSNSRIVICKS